ncbi:DNA polymerase [Gregarina niphandrodes]|uniref:DNA polymerase epsilon catalytic subunit n=1 Tax=Gregarina niphandrodes TaxID=110365 RepID=A0A023AX39_GRENI|nr:DNA polymerase [Gregarina niphandrodes]EZG43301.1 DNA polymerase [Gregarina niphandrodes]|eukprot:XP_011133443.1 DNA polymerase [Gregarina niphandrodes]
MRQTIRRNQEREGSVLRQTKQDVRDEVSSYVKRLIDSDTTYLIDSIYEHDIDIATAYMIDRDIRCGKWYMIDSNPEDKDFPIISSAGESWKSKLPLLRILAWDIETHKAPLKFPQAEIDPVMSISYYTNQGGYLLVNRQHFSRDIADFTFQFKSEFKVYNFDEEKTLLKFFLWHVQCVCNPHILVTYNGDSFDFPYVMERCTRNGLSLKDTWGFQCTELPNMKTQFTSPIILHIDCLKWVERDSYLPCGSRGLKAVARAKLRYEPREVDPELMVEYCWTKPQIMAEYSVSDALATYKLYTQYVHNFTLALSSIIPLVPDDVLRKGSGTLCEHLLMAEAYHRNILIPNKSVQDEENWMDENTLLFSETYVGGQVEQLRSGIYRHDIPEQFVFDSAIVDELVENLDYTYEVWLKHEVMDSSRVILGTNWESEVKRKICERLMSYRLARDLKVEPLIYHMDVGAMYPNIILSQRLQPYSIVDEETDCFHCPYYKERAQCQRQLKWRWKAEKYNLDRALVRTINDQLRVERFPLAKLNGEVVMTTYTELPLRERREIQTARLKQVAAKTNKNKFKTTLEKSKTSFVCQRQSSFYVDTVRDFRDRRLVYKRLKKVAEKELSECSVDQKQDKEAAAITYDSLQLAHKCILNSFYGYVMRKGARWYSLEMAAIVTHTGATIIQMARDICAGIGIPLELDTDGVWTLLPKGFPDTFEIEVQIAQEEDGHVENACMKNGPPENGQPGGQGGEIEGRVRTVSKTFKFSYPCWMLNAMVEKAWLNDQYHTFDRASQKFKLSSENSVFFEIDGPYRGMFLPASEKENQQLKKRYAVYDFDGTICELKGFELKRRGDLELLKIFQESVFPSFILGHDKSECYRGAGAIADNWMAFVRTKGRKCSDFSTVLRLLAESTNMSRPASKAGDYKSMGITTAFRLTECYNDETYINDSGIRCTYVILKYPIGLPRTHRAAPISIFSAEPQTRDYWLTKWAQSNDTLSNLLQKGSSTKGVTKLDGSGPAAVAAACDERLRDLIDWDYYAERLQTTVQKIVVIPALQQKVGNPCVVPAPAWCNIADLSRQLNLREFVIKGQRSALSQGKDSFSKLGIPERDTNCEKGTDWEVGIDCEMGTDWANEQSPVEQSAVEHSPVHTSPNENTVPANTARTLTGERGDNLDQLGARPWQRWKHCWSSLGVASLCLRRQPVLNRQDLFDKGTFWLEDIVISMENEHHALVRHPAVNTLYKVPIVLNRKVLLLGEFRPVPSLGEIIDRRGSVATGSRHDGRDFMGDRDSVGGGDFPPAGGSGAGLRRPRRGSIGVQEHGCTVDASHYSVDALPTKVNILGFKKQPDLVSVLTRSYSYNPRLETALLEEPCVADCRDHARVAVDLERTKRNYLDLHSRLVELSLRPTNDGRYLIINSNNRVEFKDLHHELSWFFDAFLTVTGDQGFWISTSIDNTRKPRILTIITGQTEKMPQMFLLAVKSVGAAYENMEAMVRDASARLRTARNRSVLRTVCLSESLRWALSPASLDCGVPCLTQVTYVADYESRDITLDLHNRTLSKFAGLYQRTLRRLSGPLSSPLRTVLSASTSDGVASECRAVLWRESVFPRHVGSHLTEASPLLPNFDRLADLSRTLAVLSALLNEKMEDLAYADGVLHYLTTSREVQEAYEQLCCTWLPLWQRRLVNQLSAAVGRTRRQPRILELNDSGLLIEIPTLKEDDAILAAKALIGLWNRESMSNKLFKTDACSVFKHGLILDPCNKCFLNNDGEIVVYDLPILEQFPDRPRRMLEDLVIQFLELPKSCHSSRRERAAGVGEDAEPDATHSSQAGWHESDAAATQAGWYESLSHAQFVEHITEFVGTTWYRLVDEFMAKFAMPPVAEAFPACVQDSASTPCYSLALGLLECLTRKDECAFNRLPGDEGETTPAALFEDLLASQAQRQFGSVVGVVVTNVRCASCNSHISQTASFEGVPVCPQCLHAFSDAEIESKLVQYFELLYVAHSLQQLKCSTCHKVARVRCSNFCPVCGGQYTHNQNLPGLLTAGKILLAYATQNDWSWLAAVVEQALSMIL